MVHGGVDFANTFEGQVVVTVAIALGAIGGAYGVRRVRVALADRIAPVAVDVVGSLISIGVMAGAVALVAHLWGQGEALLRQFDVLSVEQHAPQVAVTVVVIIAVQVFTTIVGRLLDDITRESDAMSEHEREISYRVTQLALWVVALIIVLGVWRVNLGGLLVGAGFLGIVMGLAAQQTLGSLLAGFTLMFSRPFEVGDWIVVGQGESEHEGIVTDITMMNTRIQGFDGEFIVVPNDVISGRTVRNRSRKGRLRMEVEVGVDYQADVEHAREVATEAVAEVDMIMDVPRAECVTKEFGDSAVVLGARGWIEHPSSRRRWRATTRMVRAIHECFQAEGIKIPFPQRELSGREEQDGLRLASEGIPRDARRAQGTAPGDRSTPQDGAAADGLDDDGTASDDAETVRTDGAQDATAHDGTVEDGDGGSVEDEDGGNVEDGDGGSVEGGDGG